MGGLILFDDGRGDLSPLCDLQASFELRSGAVTTAERLADQVGRPADGLCVRGPLAELVAARLELPVNRLPDADALLVINGRLTRITFHLPDRINHVLVDAAGNLIAGLLDRAHAEQFFGNECAIPGGAVARTVETDCLLQRPWDLLRYLADNVDHDLPRLTHLPVFERGTRADVTVIGDHPLRLGRGAVICPQTVFDTSAGPICIDEETEVRSLAVVVGPAYIGRGSIVANHAHIRAHTVIGPVCKVGGEINGCLFAGYANKAHGGYLGNTYVGQWSNLGAGTITSNLKNTYGQVRMQQHADTAAEPTGMQYLGSIIGDHVKTAIGTRLPTGACIGTGASLAVSGFAPKHVRRFAFLTDEGEARYDLDRFCATAHTMMQRRNQTLSDAMRRRLQQLYEAQDRSATV